MKRQIMDGTECVTGLDEYTGRIKVAVEGDEIVAVVCCWWAMCENDATCTRRHPVFGQVPICDRCFARCEDLER